MENIFHRVKANLYDNVLTDDPNDFVARVISERTLSTTDICKSAVNREEHPLHPKPWEHNVNLFLKRNGLSTLR